MNLSERLTPLGDGAYLIAVPADRAAAVARALIGAPAIEDVVPAALSILIRFDPLADRRAIRRTVRQALAAPESLTTPREHLIEVRYNGTDLAEVAALTGRSVAEVIAAHQAVDHRVRFLGFAPGFPYLAGSPFQVPRLATPRDRVPAGSVALAGGWTGIYPAASPGGWRLIGRTDATLFDPLADPPALLAPGDLVRFVAR